MTTKAAIVLFTLVGFGTGYWYRAAMDAWSDYRATKARLPGLMAAAWSLTRTAVLAIVLGAICIGVGMYLPTPQ